MWCIHAALAILASPLFVTGVDSKCKMEDTECEYYLSVSHHLSMMKRREAVFPEKGKLFLYNVRNTSAATPLEEEKDDGLVQLDGYESQMLLILVNLTMPGPTIEAYEGQTLIIHVHNHLHSEALSIHWHGLHQKGTSFMDGVAFLSQCPVLPGQTFTYRFKAEPKGTFWYHSHLGNQRTMGLFGPLIIREKKPMQMEEHIMSLQDWNHHDSSTNLLHLQLEAYENREKKNLTSALNGALFGHFFFKSGLINGRGRLYYPSGGDNEAPLTVFKVKKGQLYRFRVIGAGNLHPFHVSIDQHEMTIVASDGYELKPRIAQSFVINPGERIDFIINAANTVGNYWIRAKTLEAGLDHHVDAILRYEGADDVDPTSSKRQCTEDQPCVVVNCPFNNFDIPNTRCIRFDQLKSLDGDPAPEVKEGKFKEYFYNWAFPGITEFPGQVNGRTFQLPQVSAISQPDEVGGSCEDVDCGEDKTCKCTYTVDLEYGDTVQMVYLNHGTGKGFDHPIHLHGHSFYVLKMGYPPTDPVTGVMTGDNMDIDCGDTKFNFCNNPTWRNKSWSGNNIPGLELKNPPRKDTIIVPTGGYVVIRIRADNPGLWFMHCHIELHADIGMAMVVREAADRFPPIPDGFPTCSPFKPKPKSPEPTKAPMGPDSSTKRTGTGGGNMFSGDIFWIVVGCLIGLCVLQFIIILYLCLRKKPKPETYDMKQQPNPQENKAFQRL